MIARLLTIALFVLLGLAVVSAFERQAPALPSTDLKPPNNAALEGKIADLEKRIQGLEASLAARKPFLSENLSPPGWWIQMPASADYAPLATFSKEFDIPRKSVVIATINGHIQVTDPNNWVYLKFFANNAPVTTADWGNYHIYGAVTNGKWAPVSFSQKFEVPAGRVTLALKYKSGSAAYINGALVNFLILPIE